MEELEHLRQEVRKTIDEGLRENVSEIGRLAEMDDLRGLALVGCKAYMLGDLERGEPVVSLDYSAFVDSFEPRIRDRLEISGVMLPRNILMHADGTTDDGRPYQKILFLTEKSRINVNLTLYLND